MAWTEEEKRKIWNTAKIIPERKKDRIRKDACGAIIKWNQYGNRDSPYGWEIDHILPKANMEELGIPEDLWNELDNLRAMHHANNNSKGDDFPKYKAVITSEGDKNIECNLNATVNKNRQDRIYSIYWSYLLEDDDIDY